MRIALPYPPSVNSYWRHPTTGKLAGRHLISSEGRNYRDQVARLVSMDKPMDDRLIVSIIAHMPDKRRRDLDNIPKAIFDALTHAGLWLDDEQIDVLTISRAEVVKGGMVVVDVQPIGAC